MIIRMKTFIEITHLFLVYKHMVTNGNKYNADHFRLSTTGYEQILLKKSH